MVSLFLFYFFIHTVFSFNSFNFFNPQIASGHINLVRSPDLMHRIYCYIVIVWGRKDSLIKTLNFIQMMTPSTNRSIYCKENESIFALIVNSNVKCWINGNSHHKHIHFVNAKIVLAWKVVVKNSESTAINHQRVCVSFGYFCWFNPFRRHFYSNKYFRANFSHFKCKILIYSIVVSHNQPTMFEICKCEHAMTHKYTRAQLVDLQHQRLVSTKLH